MPRGAPVDRYVVLSFIGSGGMGTVYAAYDPELDRKVALKLLRRPAASDSRENRRLLREAQALARLTHPNVVVVHDAGVHEDRVWLAMELVEGVTLREWLRAKGRHWSQILEISKAAARGVAAAHAADLCHRDLKPENIMVGDDGRVRVMDFGLARGPSEASVELEGDSEPSRMDARVTGAGMLVGTPAYMAPERFAGYEGDQRSDQFGLCVTIWEALYGERPFAGDSDGALELVMLEGHPRMPSGAARVPSWLRRVCERGLRADPEQRWSSVEAMLVALERGSGRRRRWGAAFGGLGLVAVAVVGASMWMPRAEPCAGARAHLEGIWDEERRDEVHRAMRETAAPNAEAVWEWVAAQLDPYADRWVASHTDACEATTVRGEQSAAVMDLRMACLERAKLELVAVTEVLAHADDEVLSSVSGLMGGLRPLATCGDVVALQAEVEPPRPDEADAVHELRSRLAGARAAREAGRYHVAEERLGQAEAMLAGIEYEPVRTEVLVERGRLLDARAYYPEAEAVIRHAVRSGAKLGQRDELREATRLLILVMGHHKGRLDEALSFRDHAMGLARGDFLEEEKVRRTIADVLHAQGKYEEAEAERRAALAQERKALGPDHPVVADTTLRLGTELFRLGRYPEADEEIRRAIEIYEDVLGVEHRSAIHARFQRGQVLMQLEKPAEAEAELRLVLRVQERVLGDGHPEVASTRGMLAEVLRRLGRFAQGEEEARRALVVVQRTLGPDHPYVLSVRNTLANLLSDQGRNSDAEEQLRRILASMESRLGPEHGEVAKVRANLGLSILGRGRRKEGLAELRPALAIAERAWGAEHLETALIRAALGGALDHPDDLDEAEQQLHHALRTMDSSKGSSPLMIAMSRSALASVLLARGRADEALPLAEAAWQHYRGVPEVPDGDRANVSFALAKVLWSAHPPGEARRDARARSLELAERALEDYLRGGEAHRQAAVDVEAWLDERR